jgi:hypothetical protein
MSVPIERCAKDRFRRVREPDEGAADVGATPRESGSQSDYRGLHEALCSNGATTDDVRVGELIQDITRRLQRRYQVRDIHQAMEAACDVVWRYVKAPSAYDITAVPLVSLLTFYASRRLLNHMGRTRRRLSFEIPLADVVAARVQPRAFNQIVARSLVRHLLRSIRDPRDRALLLARLYGKRRTDELAAALGVSDLTPPDRLRAVKQAKDRLDKAVVRWWTRLSANQNTRFVPR